MILNVPDELFKTVKHQFDSLDDGGCLDEHVRNIVLRWRNNPYSDKIIPRWSCQGHSEMHYESEFEIIFCTINDGSEILYRLFEEMVKTNVERYGEMYQAGTSFDVVMLCHPDFSGYHPHIKISTTNAGHESHILKCVSVWEELLDKMENGKL